MTENPERPSNEPFTSNGGDLSQPSQRAASAAGSPDSGAEAPQTPAPSSSMSGPATAATTPIPAQQQPHNPTAAYPAPMADGSVSAQQSGSIYDIPAPRASASEGAFGPAADQQAKREKSRDRRFAVPVIAALAVGAILGGASGAGIYALVDNNNPQVVNQTGQSTNTIVNRADDATAVTAVAAKASPSVVTLSVSSSSGSGTGSGIILSADGYILTNNHVVTLDGASSAVDISVTMDDGTIYPATVVGTDPIVDLAVVKLDNVTGLTPIEWADSEALNVGDDVVAIGAPLGLSGTVTEGIISSLNRSITVASSEVPDTQGDSSEGGSAPYDFWNEIPGQEQQQQQTTGTISIPVVQTDAAINPGNSGGALLNADGELVGVNVAIASAGGTSSTSGSIGVGFAIPANLAQRVSEEIIASGSATHGLLGASVATSIDVDPTIGVAGAYIQQVTSGGAAEAAGLQEGDIITRFNGITIASSTDLTAQVRYLAAGETADIVYVRNGQSYEATATLGTLSL